MKVKNIKDNKAITLVSLVITIVIMLILAAISVKLIIGDNGLFTKATKAATVYQESKIKEASEMQVAEADINSSSPVEVINWEQADTVINKDGVSIANPFKGVFLFNEDYNTWEYENHGKQDVLSITIETSINEPKFPDNAVPEYSIKIAKDSSMDAILYYVDNGGKTSMGQTGYDMHIVSTGKIILPENCERLFCMYCELKEIKGIESLDTSKVTNMDFMFNGFGYENFEELVFPSSFDTSHVTSMECMFSAGGTNFKKLYLGKNFDISHISEDKKKNIFYGCGHKNQTELVSDNQELQKLFSERTTFDN